MYQSARIAHTHIYIYIYTYTYTHTHIYIYIYICVCAFVCICVYVCACEFVYVRNFVNILNKDLFQNTITVNIVSNIIIVVQYHLSIGPYNVYSIYCCKFSNEPSTSTMQISNVNKFLIYFEYLILPFHYNRNKRAIILLTSYINTLFPIR